jgi:hypothetical protein
MGWFFLLDHLSGHFDYYNFCPDKKDLWQVGKVGRKNAGMQIGHKKVGMQVGCKKANM